MSRRFVVAVLFVHMVLFFGTTTAVYAKSDISIASLIEVGELYDNQQIIIEGEVVGDIPKEENGFRWLTLEDSSGASISVRASEEDAKKIVHLGRYDQVGTRIEVSGVFQIGCDTHDGLTDVHAQSVKVIDIGHEVASELSPRKTGIGALLIVVGLGLVILYWRLRERTR